ncbi:MAG: Ig-like domain-containing protein [Acidobacteriota bacterium]
MKLFDLVSNPYFFVSHPTYRIASFLPDPALQTNTAYKATIGTGVAAAGGTHMAASYSYAFTTRASTDTSPLSINSVSPADNATCVSASMPIVITFNEAPDASTVNASNIMVAGPGGAAVAVTMSINVSTTQVVLKPTAPLPSGTITVTVQNVADLAGVKMTTPYTWSYSTACGGGGGTGGGATMQYEATLLLAAGQSTMNGRVSVDTSGNTTIHLTNATASTTYSVQFCPAFDSNTGSPAPACLNVTTLSTDASGNASSTVKFPKPATGPVTSI